MSLSSSSTPPDPSEEEVPDWSTVVAPPMLRLIDEPTQRGGVGDYARFAEYRDARGIFIAVSARPISAGATDRCDADRYGPFGYHKWDEDAQICICGSTDMPDPNMGNHLITMENIEWVDVIFDAAPIGYLLYLEHKTAELDEQIRLVTPTATRTLQELFRIMIEWDFAYKELGNTELVSKTCSGILDSMGMPDEFRSWLLSDVDDQFVARYLKGNVRARDRGKNVPPLPDLFDDWTTRLLVEKTRQLGVHRA